MVRRCTCSRNKLYTEVGLNEEHGKTEIGNPKSPCSLRCECAKNVQGEHRLPSEEDDSVC